MKIVLILLLFTCLFSSSSVKINKVANKNITIDTISVSDLILTGGFFQGITDVNKTYRNQITEKQIYFKLDTILSNLIYITNIHCKNKHIDLLKLDSSKLTKKDTLLLNSIKPSFRLLHTSIDTKSKTNEISFDLIVTGKKVSSVKISINEYFNLLSQQELQNIDSTYKQKKYTINRNNGFDSLFVTLDIIPHTAVVVDETVDSVFWKNNANLLNIIYDIEYEKNIIDFTRLPNREYNFFYLGCKSAGNFTIEIVD